MAKASTSAFSSLPISPVFYDFEPCCEWKRGEDSLIVHVPEFKKEHLRVQVNTSGVLKISGDRPLDGHPTKRSRFFKETRVPEGCNINHVNAKLCGGKLTIAMPRTSLNYVSPQPPPLPASAELPEGKSGGKGGAEKDGEELDDEVVGFGGLRMGKKMAVRVGVAVAAVAAIGAALLVFRSSSSSSSVFVVGDSLRKGEE